MGDPPYKACLSLLPGNLLPEVAKSLPVSASVGCVGRRRRGRQTREDTSGGSAFSFSGGQMEYVVGVGREVCVGFNSGRFCRINCSRMHGMVIPPGLQHPGGWVQYSASKGNQF